MRIAETRDGSDADLLPKVYAELRKIAAAQMAQWRTTQTIQPTALVHEAWLRLGGSSQVDWTSQAHFVAAAAEAMRHILIDRARRRLALRHGGDRHRVSLDHFEQPAEIYDAEMLLAVNDVLDKLALEHPRMAELVKLHCFMGLEISQAALALDISRATATRWWLFARTWLYKKMHA